MITKWKPEAVRAAALAELQANAEIVGKFVETEARRRLDAITQPDNKRAINYRKFLSKYILTYTVEKTAKAIVIRVGLRSHYGKTKGHRGFFIETGSTTAPAHPYLRPAVFDNGSEIVALLGGR